MLFGELFAISAAHQWGVQVLRCGQAQGLLQQSLTRCIVCKVFTAHDVRNALRTIIDYHGQLVGPQAIGTTQNKIANSVCHILLLRPQTPVMPRHSGCILGVQAPSAGWSALQA